MYSTPGQPIEWPAKQMAGQHTSGLKRLSEPHAVELATVVVVVRNKYVAHLRKLPLAGQPVP